MKELSIDEKAEAYDKALERVKDFIEKQNPPAFDKNLIGTIFPELKESEDEKIRKEIIDYFQADWAKEEGITRPDWIAWLEKQGVPTDINPSEFDLRLNKLLKQFETLPKEELVNCLSFYLNTVQNDGIYQRADNPADKVKPKFKVGDWVVQGHNIMKIKCVGDTHYCFETVSGYVDDMLVSEIDSQFHLWAIQDAKDGDVLFHSDSASNGIFIFKELLKYEFSEKVICYCDYDSEDHFCLGEHHTCCWADAKILHPATKEQRGTLFAKMKEAGYEWDAEKKELKKIHIIDEGKAEMDYCFTKMMNGEKMKIWLESLKYRIHPRHEQLKKLKGG